MRKRIRIQPNIAHWLKSDPNYSLSSQDVVDSGSKGFTNGEVGSDGGLADAYHFDPYPSGLQGTQDPNEEKVYQKIAQINSALRRNEQVNPKSTVEDASGTYRLENNAIINSTDIDRLEGMMNAMQDNGEVANPEMNQISSVLDKILDIQHPDRISAQLPKESISKQGTGVHSGE